ncbi:YfhO family protein [Streptomyces sp. NPDC058280]|uniref:YfhO family protein n=1 Tax=Streptomyces sp. NPDC058280 TaxID=3346419 RepID=UPI0036E77C0A
MPFRPAGDVRGRAALLAAALTVVAFCAGDAAARTFPFGPGSRSVNDLGNEYVPLHAYLWDLLHGRGDGGLFINWRSGFGASLLPDLGTYLTSPFAPLVALFPRDEIDLAVYVITVLKMATAGAAMACLLLTLRTGRWWIAGILGASYALCGWSVLEASYNPMWVDGLIALPLLCLVGGWAMSGRHRVLGPVVVAVVWAANFYTAYMATIGAALVLLARLPLDGPVTPYGAVALRERLLVLRRAAVSAALGIGLAAPVVVVVYFGTRHAYPGAVREFTPEPWADVFAGVLPGAWSFGTPASYVDTAALLLALTLPFNRAVPRRERGVWSLLVVAMALSMQWGPTHLAWHAFATPNGSPYRQTFVLCGLLVIAAWTSMARDAPGRRALLAAGALLALLIAVAWESRLISVLTIPLLLAGLAATALALTLLRTRLTGRRGGGRWPLFLTAALLVGTQFVQSAATTAYGDVARIARLDDYGPWGQRQARQAETIAEADGWPRYRTDPGREQTVGNDPMLVGGQGAQYYSSVTSDVLSRTLTALGGGYTSGGRSVQSLDNAVTDAVFSVGVRLHSPPDPYQEKDREKDREKNRSRDRDQDRDAGTDLRGPTVSRQDVPPLVTVRSTGTAPAFGPSAYRNQEKLLGAEVYTLPRISVRASDGAPAPRRDEDASGYRIPGPPTKRSAEPAYVLTASCPAGSEVHLWAPTFRGTATLSGSSLTQRFHGDSARRRAAMQPLGAAPASGRVAVDVTSEQGGVIPDGAIGCLDPVRLRTAVDRLTSTGATEVTVSGSTVRAELPPGSAGVAVLAVPRIAGWRCAAGDGAARPAGEYLGLVAVPFTASTTAVTCAFHPPGLRLGLTLGAAALLALILLHALPGRRARRAAHRLRRRREAC